MKYACSFCGREGVKLWYPFISKKLLVCASCAEARQSVREYPEIVWEETPNGYEGKTTGKMIPLERWTVDEKGRIPLPYMTGPNGGPIEKTDQLTIDFHNDTEGFAIKAITLMPAITNQYGEVCSYIFAKEERKKLWEKMPNT